MRSLLLGLLAQGKTRIRNVLSSPDTERVVIIAKKLGAKITCLNGEFVIEGVGQNPLPTNEPLDVGNSGILRRFLTGMLATTPHRYRLTGDASVMARPMQTLLDALQLRGVKFFSDGSFQGPFQPGTTYVNGEDSQPVSALLFAAAMTSGESTIHVDNPGELPWVDLTLHWLRMLGIPFERRDYSEYKVRGGKILAFDYTVPCDYSTAAFPYAAGLLTRGNIQLSGLDPNDVQGDKEFLEMDILNGGTHDLNRCIDAVPIAAVMACFAKKPVELSGISIARTKECDRLQVMTQELRKMGADIDERPDSLYIRPCGLKGAEVHSHGDHRIALALSIAGFCATGKTTVVDTGCIEKTFPDFVTKFRALGASIEVAEK